MSILPPGIHHFNLLLPAPRPPNADNGHQEQDRGDLEGQQVIGKEAAGDRFGVPQARGWLPGRGGLAWR